MNQDANPAVTTSSAATTLSGSFRPLLRAMRPAQWIKNGLVFAGLVYGGKLLEPGAVATAVLAAVLFCIVSSGFYLINDVRDIEADRLHPDKRFRPIAAGELAPGAALAAGIGCVVAALVGSAMLSRSFLVVILAYAALMGAYNLGVKNAVILDVFAIAGGFVLRAIGGAVAVDVTISPWLLLCTMLLALLIGFGKRRYELVWLPDAGLHRRNLHVYSRSMLDQAVAVSAAGTLIVYVIYSLDTNNVIHDHRFMLTAPIVAYGVFRYLHVLYHHGQGGAPESLVVGDRGLLAAILTWSVLSALLLYLPD
jgi:4-hydroxybenzoate polyprenyltransferase